MFKKKKACQLLAIALVTFAIVMFNNSFAVVNDDRNPLHNIQDFSPAAAQSNRLEVNSPVGSKPQFIISRQPITQNSPRKADFPGVDAADPADRGSVRGLLEVKRNDSWRSIIDIRELEQVSRRVERCLAATHLDDNADFRNKALENALYFLMEFRTVIPDQFLGNYSSHCWKQTFEALLNQQAGHLRGFIGQQSFDKLYPKEVQKECLYHLMRRYENHFSSSLVCLPKVFILGFPKCGSTFLWCFLEKILGQIQRWPAHSEKEPHFWMRAPFPTTPIRKPVVSDISDYITNFVGGIDQIRKGNKKLILMDGNPNLIFISPHFLKDRDSLENNCLLPALLPHLLPKAIYIVVMRNPIKMLYSAFWFSCTCCHPMLTRATQIKGPNLFHDRVTTKINKFNDCMRDEEVPAISHPCSLTDSNYGQCIRERLHLIDRCVEDITYDLYSPELSNCGKSRIERGLYYVHIRKWLSVVPREKFFFVTLEEISSDPQRVAEEMLHAIDDATWLSHLASTAKSAFDSCAKENTQKTIDYKNRKELNMRKDTEELLQLFFEPFNILLADLLGDSKYTWK